MKRRTSTKTATPRRTMMDFPPPPPPPVKPGRFFNQEIRLLKPFAVFTGSRGWRELAHSGDIGHYQGERYMTGFIDTPSGDHSVIKLEHVTAFMLESIDFEFVD